MGFADFKPGKGVIVTTSDSDESSSSRSVSLSTTNFAFRGATKSVSPTVALRTSRLDVTKNPTCPPLSSFVRRGSGVMNPNSKISDTAPVATDTTRSPILKTPSTTCTVLTAPRYGS